MLAHEPERGPREVTVGFHFVHPVGLGHVSRDVDVDAGVRRGVLGVAQQEVPSAIGGDGHEGPENRVVANGPRQERRTGRDPDEQRLPPSRPRLAE